MKVDRHKAFNLYCKRNKETFKFYTVKEVAKELDLKYSYLKDVSVEMGWREKRKECLKKRAERAREYITETSAKMEAENYKLFDRTKKLLIDSMVQLEEKRDKDGKVSPWAIKEVIEGLGTVNKNQRVICGLPNEINRGEITNINKEIPLTDEEVKKIDEDLKKANDKSEVSN